MPLTDKRQLPTACRLLLVSCEGVRVIGGVYRSRRLRAVTGQEVRPTSDRLRETLFNILGARVRDSRFLDLCAGSGAVGIEALSRGARQAVFIEHARRACLVIEANLRELGITDQASLICRDALAGLKSLSSESESFDHIFFDPPYASGIYSTVLSYLGEGFNLADDAVVVVEHRAKTPLASDYGRLKAFRQLQQGESALAFYQVI